MAMAGLGDDVIVAAIEQAPAHAFALTPSGLIALKKGKVSDAVIREMQRMASGPSGTGAPASPARTVPALARETTTRREGAPEATAPPKTVAVTLKKGASIRVRAPEGLTAKGMNVGDPVALVVASDVTVDGHLVVREGAPVAARATQVGQRSLSRLASLSFSVDSVAAVSGETIPLRAGTGSDATIAVLGGVAKPGSVFIASTGADMAVEVAARAVPADAPATERLPETGRMPPAGTTRDLPDRETGIYLDQNEQLILVRPTLFSSVNTGSLFKTALTYGMAKGSQKIVITPGKAKLRVGTPTPSFVFYLDKSALGEMSNPSEFVLARVDEKSKQRELVVGKTAAAGIGGSAQIDEDHVVDMQIDLVRPGVFRVSPKTPLSHGEYCFYYPGGNGKVFDFGIE
jgi:hypothetical protein